MTRLIDADYLKEQIDYNQEYVNPKLNVYDILRIIDNAPTVEKRPKGKWRCAKQGDIPITDRCTNCNYEMKWYKNKHNYCPNCGADMRGDEE